LQPESSSAVQSSSATGAPESKPAKIAPPASVPINETDSLQAAMDAFAKALSMRDVDAFLSHFSRRRAFTLLGTIDEPYRAARIKYADLSRELHSGDRSQGWYAEFMGDEDESFALSVASAEHRPWKRVGKHKFVLPDDDANSRMFVVWRKEGPRWVIDTIAIPDA